MVFTACRTLAVELKPAGYFVYYYIVIFPVFVSKYTIFILFLKYFKNDFIPIPGNKQLIMQQKIASGKGMHGMAFCKISSSRSQPHCASTSLRTIVQHTSTHIEVQHWAIISPIYDWINLYAFNFSYGLLFLRS